MTYLFTVSGNVPIALSTDGGLTWEKVAEIVPVKPKGSRSPKNIGSKGNGAHLRGTASGDQPSISAGAGSVWVSYTVYPSQVVQAFGAPVTGLDQFGDFSTPQNVPTAFGKGNYGDTAVGGFDYLPVQPHRSVDAEASLAYDRSGGAHDGRLYAIWTQEVKNESDNMDIMFQYSDDDGADWTSAVRLNDDAGTNSQVNPSISVDKATGFVGIAWYDARNDLGDGGPGDTNGMPNDDVQIWATFSTDGGATFVPNFQVSAGTSNSSGAESSI